MKPTIVLLAGGLGTRLGDLTKDCQKCMVPINGRPFLDILIQLYRSQGFERFVINTGHLAEQVESYDFGPNVTFVRDTKRHQGWDRISQWDINTYVFQGYYWVCNGDTWPLYDLPDTTQPTICVADGIDAGTQFVGYGKIHIHKVPDFIDIGSHDGLKRFEEYWGNKQSGAI